MRKFSLLGLVSVALFAAPNLPNPSGSYAVGRTTVHWTDPTRIESLSPTHAPRELMVDIWYPAESATSPFASYLDTSAFERALTPDGVRKQLGAAYESVKSGSVTTHAIANAPISRLAKGFPVLIFSHGGGMIRELYTAQLEHYASHGYVIAAISHPYDAFAMILPNGSAITYDSKRWPHPPSLEGEANLNKLDWHAADFRFVIDKLATLPFAQSLDLNRIGAFGHSFGGISAAHACQTDPRLKACLNQDGLNGMRPYYLDNRGWGMDQAFMLIVRSSRNDEPSEAELKEMKVTRPQLTEILARLNAYQDRTLQNTGKGGYRVILDRTTSTHMDFSDLPLLSGKSVPALIAAQNYTLAFFDKYLKGKSSPLLDKAEKFAAARPKR
ncbi:MAG: hypothetical protein HYX27_19145 [Acidobacteria bacterium]|nr:hypothetical protein [Acidobacteriota bacterium]